MFSIRIKRFKIVHHHVMAPEPPHRQSWSRIGAGASSKYRFKFLILFTLQVNGYGSELEPEPEPHNFFMPELH
jgi:hypothetical protein